MIVDAHLHTTGQEKTTDVLRSLDEAEIDVGVLLAPFLSEGYALHDRESLQRANQYLGRLVAPASDRLIGFAVVNPALPGAVEDLRIAVEIHRLKGLKMVPSGWYPYDEEAHAVYEAAAQYDLPILFHSGIFIDGRSGRYCRPVFYEAVRQHPKLRVTLAHLGWPWTDEANAVGLIDLINGVAADDAQFRFDLSFGAPPVYRLEVLRRALAVLSPSLLQFGSDRFFPCPGSAILDAREELVELLNQLEVNADDRARIVGGTAAAWLRLQGAKA